MFDIGKIVKSKLFQFICWANVSLFAFVAVQNYSTPSSMAVNRVAEKSIYHPGDLVTINYHVIRFKSCTLHINRVLVADIETLTDPGREYLIATEDREVNGTGNLIPSTFTVKIPEFMHPGKYRLVSRVRYYCNPLDYLLPHVNDTQSVPIEIQ